VIGQRIDRLSQQIEAERRTAGETGRIAALEAEIEALEDQLTEARTEAAKSGEQKARERRERKAAVASAMRGNRTA
jgi:hypothetical protein